MANTDYTLIAIDDEPELLAIIVRAGEEMGFRAASTTDAEAFKTMIQSTTPAVVVMDLQMPGVDGIELLRFLFEQQCRAHVVLISGVDPRVLMIAKGVGDKLGLKMAEPLNKPIRVSALRSALHGFLPARSEIDAEALRCGLVDNQLSLYYQPLINLRESRLIGWEALVRWHHPDHGLIMPDNFIPMAERDGVIDQLTDRVLELAIGQIAQWQRDEGRKWFVSVNISAGNLADTKLPDRIERLCQTHQVHPDFVRLELTETAAMSDSVQLVEVLTRLRVKGFKLAIDDFGTGFSSLVQLHRLPFSELKIDQMFVRNMATSEEANIIVKAIINLAHSLHLETIAEGVETQDLAARLTAAGCEIAQGYYFGRPMPPRDIAGWLAVNASMLHE